MAFCNSCGANLDGGTRFCNKCGAAVLASAAAPSAPVAAPVPGTVAAPPAAPTSSGGGALKIILIVVAIFVGLGMLGLAGAGFAAWRIAKIAKSAHMREDGNGVKVEMPFGSVETSKDPADAARDLGVDVYPGAVAQKDGTATASMFGIHTVTAAFDSSDSLDKVSTFYKSKFPNAMATTSDDHHCTIVSSDKKNMITINLETTDEGTKILITNVSGKALSGGSSNSSSN
jgi:hypothetical protein